MTMSIERTRWGWGSWGGRGDTGEDGTGGIWQARTVKLHLKLHHGCSLHKNNFHFSTLYIPFFQSNFHHETGLFPCSFLHHLRDGTHFKLVFLCFYNTNAGKPVRCENSKQKRGKNIWRCKWRITAAKNHQMTAHETRNIYVEVVLPAS